MRIIQQIKCKFGYHSYTKQCIESRIKGGYYKWKYCDTCGSINTKSGNFKEFMDDLKTHIRHQGFSPGSIEKIWQGKNHEKN